LSSDSDAPRLGLDHEMAFSRNLGLFNRGEQASVSQALVAVAAAVAHEASAYLAHRQGLVYVPHYRVLDLTRSSFRRWRVSTIGFLLVAARSTAVSREDDAV